MDTTFFAYSNLFEKHIRNLTYGIVVFVRVAFQADAPPLAVYTATQCDDNSMQNHIAIYVSVKSDRSTRARSFTSNANK